MSSTFMAAKVRGTKAEVKKANKVANIIVATVIVAFLAFTAIVVAVY